MHHQRKITAGLYVSLDAVVESPEQWHFPYANEEFLAALGESFATSDAMLLGRRTYEVFASYWPHQGSDVTMADEMNGTPKYVVFSESDQRAPLRLVEATTFKTDVLKLTYVPADS